MITLYCTTDTALFTLYYASKTFRLLQFMWRLHLFPNRHRVQANALMLSSAIALRLILLYKKDANLDSLNSTSRRERVAVNQILEKVLEKSFLAEHSVIHTSTRILNKAPFINQNIKSLTMDASFFVSFDLCQGLHENTLFSSPSFHANIGCSSANIK